MEMSEKQKIKSKDTGNASEILDKKTSPKPDEEKPLKFTLKPAKEKPKRAYRKGSKYDAIVDGFLKSPEKLVQLTVEGKDANYIRTQINKRLEAKHLTKKMSVSVTNNVCYLEKP